MAVPCRPAVLRLSLLNWSGSPKMPRSASSESVGAFSSADADGNAGVTSA